MIQRSAKMGRKLAPETTHEKYRGDTKMAFKKMNTRVERPVIDIEDEKLFFGKKISRSTVDLTWDRRHQLSGDVHYIAKADRRLDFIVKFCGARAEIFTNGLGTTLKARHQDIAQDVLDGKRDWPEDRATAITIIVEGSWEPIFWRDKDGNQRKSWNLIAARWHYQEDPIVDTVLEHGRLPVLKEAQSA
jgi:hypothetical protein